MTFLPFLSFLLFTFFLSFTFTTVSARELDLYCGEHNCYDILQLPQKHEATPNQIKKAFYKLSLQLHPDKLKSASSSPSSSSPSPPSSSPDSSSSPPPLTYQDVITAYELLSNPDSRASYDDLLANPQAYYRHLRAYYNYKYGPQQTSVLKLLSLLLLVSTITHFFYWKSRYYAIRKELAENPHVQNKVRAALKERAAAAGEKMSKEELNGRIREECRDQLDQYIEVTGWEARLPTWKDLLVFQLLRLPLAVFSLLYWYVRWVIKFNVLREEYGEEERDWLTADALNVKYGKWEKLVKEEERKELVKKELWVPKNLEKWKKEMIGAKKREKTWR